MPGYTVKVDGKTFKGFGTPLEILELQRALPEGAELLVEQERGSIAEETLAAVMLGSRLSRGSPSPSSKNESWFGVVERALNIAERLLPSAERDDRKPLDLPAYRRGKQ